MIHTCSSDVVISNQVVHGSIDFRIPISGLESATDPAIIAANIIAVHDHVGVKPGDGMQERLSERGAMTQICEAQAMQQLPLQTVPLCLMDSVGKQYPS